MLSFYRGQELSDAEARERIRRELKANLYDPNTGTLKYTKGQDQAFGTMVDFYRDWLITTGNNTGLRRPSITNEGEIRKLTAFFSWAAWTSAATRPDAPYSYTNNWPATPLPVTNQRPKPFSGAFSAWPRFLGALE
nr:hypothetical protein [Geotalea toluenoxydans]